MAIDGLNSLHAMGNDRNNKLTDKKNIDESVIIWLNNPDFYENMQKEDTKISLLGDVPPECLYC